VSALNPAARRRQSIATAEGRGLNFTFATSRRAATDSLAATRLSCLLIAADAAGTDASTILTP
jgi:hypothetical protein